MQGVGDWGDRAPKTYESNFIHHDLVPCGKQHSRYKVILSSIVLWSIPHIFYASEAAIRFDY